MEREPSQQHTIFFVPDGAGRRVRRFAIKHRTLIRAAVGASAAVLLLFVFGTHYFVLLSRSAENAALREENLRLVSELKVVHEKVQHINDVLDRVKHLNANLENITQLRDPDRQLALGPLAAAPSVESATPAVAPLAEVKLPASLEALEREAREQEQKSREMTAYFEDQKQLLASAPSVWPARGYVTSDFAVRLDPYTADRVMHDGIDIAAAPGTPIKAPADGAVVFAGLEGGYGKVLVLDHGYGLKTRYGHLSRIDVKLGQKVRRGDHIASIGTTGRSTGPHLHYEVRVNGVPENPRKFILEE